MRNGKVEELIEIKELENSRTILYLNIKQAEPIVKYEAMIFVCYWKSMYFINVFCFVLCVGQILKCE